MNRATFNLFTVILFTAIWPFPTTAETNYKLAPASAKHTTAAIATHSTKVSVGYGQRLRRSKDIYQLLEKTNEKWRVVFTGYVVPELTTPQTQEILVWDWDKNFVEPYYTPYVLWQQGRPQEKENTPMQCRSKESELRPKYNPCDSSLSSPTGVVGDVVANTFLGYVTLGISVAGGGVFSRVETDPKKVLYAVENADALQAVQTFRNDERNRIRDEAEQLRLKAYRYDFSKLSSALTVAQALEYINKYKDYDPDGLMGQAQEKLLA